MSNIEDISLLLHVMAERIDELIFDCQLEQDLIENPDEQLDNYDFCSKIKISSSLEGELILALSTDALKIILDKVFFFEYDENEDIDIINNGVCEFLNLISANSTSYMESIELPIEIGIPELLIKQKIESKSDPLPAMKIIPESGKILLMYNKL